MELPEIASKVGIVDDDRVVYIEDYALQYLKLLQQRDLPKEDKFILYGEKGKFSRKEVYMIYGVCRAEDEKCIFSKDGGRAYEPIGSLHVELWGQGGDFCQGILVGTKDGGQPVREYYVFYDADDKMKDCLSRYYEEGISRAKYIARRGQMDGGRAELVALSNQKRQKDGTSLYLLIRIAVMGILIIFCAIAVTTVNGYDKMNDFIQTAVRTSEIIDSSMEEFAEAPEKN